MLLSLAVLIVVFGIFPQILLDYINPFAQNFTEVVLNSVKRIQNP
jgi:NADH:ubiquinone oxidoreductase subunit 4 (subunit M)